MRNDKHLTTGSPKGDCEIAKLDDEVPDFIGGEVMLRRTVSTSIQSTARGRTALACARCTGAAPGCCYQALALTSYEAKTLVLAYSDFLRERWPVIVERAALEDAEIGPDATEEELTRASEAAEAWFFKRRPCIFLTDKGRCAIYKLRPFACVKYYVASDPDRCSPDWTGKVAVLDVGPFTEHLMRLAAQQERSVGGRFALWFGLARSIVRAVEALAAAGALSPENDPRQGVKS